MRISNRHLRETMADPAKELLLPTLQACAGPEPLYPVTYSQSTGLDRAVLDAALDRLRMAGLVRLTEWVKGKGQGYTLTPDGVMVLERPGLLSRAPQAAPPPPPTRTSASTTWQRGEA